MKMPKKDARYPIFGVMTFMRALFSRHDIVRACRSLFGMGIVYLLLLTSPAQLRMGQFFAQENIPDIDDVINSELEGAKDDMADLEKVIEQEESRAAGESSEKSSGRGMASNEPRKAKRSASSKDDVEVVEEGGRGRGEDENFVVGDEALGLPSDAEPSGSDVPRSSAKRGIAKASVKDEPTAAAEAPMGQEELGLPEEEAPPQQESKPQPKAITESASAMPDAGVQNEITNLEFKMEGSGSRIVVSSRQPLRYREVKNPQMKQVVYFFENTVAAERVQRAYDTTEFSSPVALFTLLQVPGESPPVSKLIVQLRESQEPSVVPTERGLYVDFGPPTQSSEEPRLAYGKQESDSSTEENIYSGDVKFTGRMIRRLEIKESDVQDVLRLIARTSGYNIVIGDDVQGKVGTLSLENIPWDQAFTLVLQMKKLGYVKQANVLRVATLGSLQEEKNAALASERAKQKVEPLRTVLIPVSYASAKDLAPKGQPFLTDRGSIDTDSRTNTVIIKDVSKSVSRIQKLLSALDTQPPRVSIAAKIVEMSQQVSRSFGLYASASTTFSGTNVTYKPPYAAGNTLVLSAPTYANLTAALQASEIESKVRILANPSVSVIANQQASVTQSQSQFIDGGAVVAAGGTAMTSKQKITTTLTLNVTPIVSGDGTIFMTVSVTNEMPTKISGNVAVDTRNVETQILMENGDTAVVGSVFYNRGTESLEGLPLFMRIPILGLLFSTQSSDDLRNEVFIFLTAKIMNAEESFKRTASS